jgi:hypothetical protein
MPYESIMAEVSELQNVSGRLTGLAENHPALRNGLLTIAGNVSSAATLLAVLVETKLILGSGHLPI